MRALLQLFSFLTFLTIYADKPSDLSSHFYEKMGKVTGWIIGFGAIYATSHTMHNIGHVLAIKACIKNDSQKNRLFDAIFKSKIALSFKKHEIDYKGELLYFVAGSLTEFAANYALLKIIQYADATDPTVKGCKAGAYAGMATSILHMIPVKIGQIKMDGYQFCQALYNS